MKKYFLIRANHPVLKYQNIKVYSVFDLIDNLQTLVGAGYEVESVSTEYEPENLNRLED